MPTLREPSKFIQDSFREKGLKTFLDQVREEKLAQIAQDTAQISEKTLWHQVESLAPVPSFAHAIGRPAHAPLSIIAEVKAKAPSRKNTQFLDVATIVQDYQKGGARAISVLTDAKHFGGSLQTLSTARQATALPLLHKEFIVSPYQLLQGKVRGASAALILAYYFQEAELQKIVAQARKVGVEAVVECSLPEELPRALQVNPDLLLINNRPIAAIPANPTQTYDQGSVDVSVRWWETHKALREWKAQPGKVLISASCISAPEHVKPLVRLPYDAVLVGNAAMVATDRIGFLKSLAIAPSLAATKKGTT